MPLTNIPKGFKVPKADKAESIAPIPAPIADAIAAARAAKK